MSGTAFDWAGLSDITSTWLRRTLERLRKQRPRTAHSDEAFCRLAEYCLIVCSEYRDAAFDAFARERFQAGLNGLRPLLEYAIKLWWCACERDKVSDRLFAWETATAGQRLLVARAWRDLETRNSPGWQRRSARVRLWQQEVDKRKGMRALPSVHKMAEELNGNSRLPPAVATFYPAYRALCESSHAPLGLDAVFEPQGPALVTRAARSMPFMAPAFAMYVPLLLVFAVGTYFSWDERDIAEGLSKAHNLLDRHYSLATGQEPTQRQ